MLLNQIWSRNISRIKVFEALTLPILPYGSEIWTLMLVYKKLLTTMEITFFRTTTAYALF
jgi:hypothetical protein